MGGIIYSFFLLLYVMVGSSAAYATNFDPAFVFSSKDSQQIYKLIQKNEWFKEFKNSPMYFGVLYDYYPALFSVSDEFGTKANGWKGAFVDYFYETILKGKQTQTFYFQKQKLVSPWGVSINNLNSIEKNMAEQLIKLFRVGEDQIIQIDENNKGSVSLIELKGLRLGVILNSKCLALGRDPKIVLRLSQICSGGSLASDAELTININEWLPALAIAREKLIGLQSVVKTSFRYNTANNSLEALEAQMNTTKNNIIVNKNFNSAVYKVIPWDSHYTIISNLKMWNGPISVTSINQFLINSNRASKEATIALVQLPVRVEGKIKTKNALVMEVGSLKQSELDQISDVFSTKFGDVYTRPICKGLIVISKSMDVMSKFQLVCDRKIPSLADRSEIVKNVEGDKKQAFGVYVSPGQFLSTKIENGFQSKVKNKDQNLGLPSEIIKSQELLKKLPNYFVQGSLNNQSIILK